jgi:hypothetical protein
MTDSSQPQNEKEQHTPIDLGFLEELLRDAGLLRGSSLDIFTTVGARGVPLVTGVTITEQSPEIPPGVDKSSNLDAKELDAADRNNATMPDGTEHE